MEVHGQVGGFELSVLPAGIEKVADAQGEGRPVVEQALAQGHIDPVHGQQAALRHHQRGAVVAAELHGQRFGRAKGVEQIGRAGEVGAGAVAGVAGHLVAVERAVGNQFPPRGHGLRQREFQPVAGRAANVGVAGAGNKIGLAAAAGRQRINRAQALNGLAGEAPEQGRVERSGLPRYLVAQLRGVDVLGAQGGVAHRVIAGIGVDGQGNDLQKIGSVQAARVAELEALVVGQRARHRGRRKHVENALADRTAGPYPGLQPGKFGPQARLVVPRAGFLPVRAVGLRNHLLVVVAVRAGFLADEFRAGCRLHRIIGRAGRHHDIRLHARSPAALFTQRMHVIYLRRGQVNGYVEQLLAGAARIAGRPVQHALLGRHGAAIQDVGGAGRQLAAGMSGPGASVIARNTGIVEVVNFQILVLQGNGGPGAAREQGREVAGLAQVVFVKLGGQRQALLVAEGVINAQAQAFVGLVARGAAGLVGAGGAAAHRGDLPQGRAAAELIVQPIGTAKKVELAGLAAEVERAAVLVAGTDGSQCGAVPAVRALLFLH